MLLKAENTDNSPPIGTPLARRSDGSFWQSGVLAIFGLFFHHLLIGTICKVHIDPPLLVQAFSPIPPPFPFRGKGGGSGGYTPVTPPGNSTAGVIRQGQAAANAAVLMHP